MIKFKKYILTLFLIHTFQGNALESSEASSIIKIIQSLENNKDPKCYATASRLEDFMYGTPLDEASRNLKIDIQKQIIFYIKQRASEVAKTKNHKSISLNDIRPIITSIANYKVNQNGDYVYLLRVGEIVIKKQDFDQYSSVSYGLRSMLSVNQDLILLEDKSLLPLENNALQELNKFINIMTLAILKSADSYARLNNKMQISKDILQETWIAILNNSSGKNTLAKSQYPLIKKTKTETRAKNTIIRDVIKQKINSYKKYNKLTESVFLRNIQVFFAKQKWPKNKIKSDNLRRYYLESLIQFASTLTELANKHASKESSPIIRIKHVQLALNLLLPTLTNNFEDVVFFPNNKQKAITIESYDLDAFRDSGFHWRLLSYALDDLEKKIDIEIDPNAAEQIVEGITQLGVLVLRVSGEISHASKQQSLTINDLSQGFEEIQKRISSYDFTSTPTIQSPIISSSTQNNPHSTFKVSNKKVGIDFMHKSSDWLNRLIRSYTQSYSEGVIKLAIPPAFGGSGVACEDLNNDGYTDILLLGGLGNKLYINNKHGGFDDITENSGLSGWNKINKSFAEVRQPIIADFDNDGNQDIFISQVNEQHKLYKNIGNNKFIDYSTQANLGGEGMVAGPATSFDFDNDGLLDIFIGNFGDYINGTLPTLSRDNQNGLPNQLFKNMGNFVFKQVSFTKDKSSNTGWTQALGHSDINQDGWQDIIVGNDFGSNKYYLNNGDGSFKEVSKQLGTNKPSYTMGIGITDLNRDLYPDLYISNIVVMQKDEKYVSPNQQTVMKFDPKKMSTIRTIEANDLFLSQQHNKQLSNYQMSTSIGRGYSATGWSWDADFFDFDNDGDDDLYCLNGMNDFSVYSSENPFYFERATKSKTVVYAKSNKEKNVFFVNNNGTLLNQSSQLGTDLKSNARSACYLDYDNDGDLDIIINNYHEKAHFLTNESKNSNNWIKVKLIGNASQKINRDAIGSTLIVSSKNNQNQWREIHSTTGYLSVHPKLQHFGLGTDQHASIKIKWTNGTTYEFFDIKANQSYEITYPNTINRIRNSQITKHDFDNNNR